MMPHSALVLVPIVCGLLGAVLAVMAALQPRSACTGSAPPPPGADRRSGTVRSRAAAALLTIAAVSSWPTSSAGREARRAILEDPTVPASIGPLIEEHAVWADRVAPALSLAALLALAAALAEGRRGRARTALCILAATASLGAAALLVVTGIHGSAVASARSGADPTSPSPVPLEGFGAAR